MIHCTEIGGMAASPEIAQEMGEWFDRNVSLPSGIFGEVKNIVMGSLRQYLDNFWWFGVWLRFLGGGIDFLSIR
jgi:hypothetical protein